MRLASPKFNFGPLLFVNIEIHPNPTSQCSITRSQGFGSTQEPPVPPFNMTDSKGHLARAPGAKTGRPDSACLFVIIRMQKRDVRVPIRTGVFTETERVIYWETKIIGTSFIHKRESAGRKSVPDIRGNHV
jgi:hypothetical protein